MLDRKPWQKPILLKGGSGALKLISTAGEAMEAIAPFAAAETRLSFRQETQLSTPCEGSQWRTTSEEVLLLRSRNLA